MCRMINIGDKAGFLALGGLVTSSLVAILSVFLVADDPLFTGTRMGSTPPDPNRPATNVYRLVLCPMVAAAITLVLGISTDKLLSAIPSVFKAYHKVAVAPTIPIRPQNMLQAYELGRISAEMKQLQLNNNSDKDLAKRDTLLQQASLVVGRPIIAAEMERCREDLTEMAEHRSPADRVLALFTLINFVWAVSVVIMLCTIGPFLWYIALPIRTYLLQLWADVLWPAILAMKPAYEPMFYAISLFVMTESCRYAKATRDPFQMVGTMTAFTGVAGVVSSWFYSTHLHAVGGGNPEAWLMLTGALIAVVSGTLACLHKSSILAYAAVGAAVFALRLTPLCRVLGLIQVMTYSDRALLIMTEFGAACGLIAMIAAVTRLARRHHPAVSTVAHAAATVGTVGYFLCLCWQMAVIGKGVTIFFGLNLLAAGMAGVVLRLPGMLGAAQGWALVYVLVLFISNPPHNEAFGAWMFVVAAMLFCVSVFLSRRPALVSAMFAQPRDYTFAV